MSAVQTETTLQRLMDERELVRNKHENLLAAIEQREDKTILAADEEQLTAYRDRAAVLDGQIGNFADELKAHRTALDQSRAIRGLLAGRENAEPDGPVYRTFYEYARDFVLTRDLTSAAALAKQWTRDEGEIVAMRERLHLLKRTPNNTLSSDVPGLQPAQHIAQIFQVIDTSRPLVAAAQRTTLDRGTLTYPQIDTPPVVAVQNTEKSEAGNTGMEISMQTANAVTYLGGGDISWQAANWSSPDAIRLWFDLAAADYALKTEQAAAQAMQHSGFSNNISSTLSGSFAFDDFMTAVGAGYAEVFANSKRTANTIAVAPDIYGYLLGLTSDQFSQFTSVNGSNVGPLNILVSRGMDAGVAVVGDMNGLLVAETAGAPVELRVTEPAIGGFEVGLIGAFKSVVVDDGSFSMITTAS